MTENCSTFTSEFSLGSTPSSFIIHQLRHMLLGDAAAADDYGEDEGYYCRLTYLLMARRRIKGPKQTPLRSHQAVFRDSRGEVSRLLQISAPSIAVGVRRPQPLLMLPAEASFVSHEMEELKHRLTFWSSQHPQTFRLLQQI